MTYSQINHGKVWGFSRWIQNIFDHITAFALVRLVAWEILEHDFNDFNLTYNPISYPLFSILWLYIRIGKEQTIQIKNGKIQEVSADSSHK
jgi:hypothetical protein